jgi:hypothetical protein
MNTRIPDEIGMLIHRIKGLECWEVSCGGSAGSMFQLALGQKIPLPIPPKESKYAHLFPQFEGEGNIFVLCPWRVDGPDGPLTSWNDTKETFKPILTKLAGTRIESIGVIPPAWDMNVRFSNSLCLHIFCDRIAGSPNYDANWHLRFGNVILAAGPGAKYIIESRGEKEKGITETRKGDKKRGHRELDKDN